LAVVETMKTLLIFCAFLAGCAPSRIVYQEVSKPASVVTDSGPFNATDYEHAAIDFRREGQLELAGAAVERARQLRLAGDTSTQKTLFRITVKDLEDAAVKFEREGKHELAREAREAALRLQNKNRKQSMPPQPVRNRALVL
jgi:hypothetical protein